MHKVNKKSRLRNARDTAAGFYGKSERWLWEHSEPRGPIPCIRIGNSVFYDWDRLEQSPAEQQAAAESEVATADQAIIADIQSLYRNGNTITEIARMLHFSESTVLHVIEHGKLPEPQLQWSPISQQETEGNES